MDNRPWMQAIEAQVAALDLLNLTITNHEIMPFINDGGWEVDQALLRRAMPFVWSKDTTQAVLQASQSIPLDTKIDRWNLNSPAVWWYFEEPLPFKTVTRNIGVRGLAFGWFLIKRSGFDDLSPRARPGLDGMPVCSWVDSNPDLVPVHRFPVQPSQTFEWEQGITLEDTLTVTREFYLKRYGQKTDHTIGVEAFMVATEGLARFLLAGLAWIEQKILIASDGPVERHTRKRAAKMMRPIQTVKVIELRRAERTGRITVAGVSEPIDWCCRWVVGGHWRQQPCGVNRAERRLTYIHPFIKGPDDKPLIAKTTVFRVDR